jgi:hypothetical protein
VVEQRLPRYAFLTTREFFILKYVNYPAMADHYLGLSAAQRSAYLARTVDKLPLPSLSAYRNETRDINRIEWFASANAMCRAFAGLSGLSSQPGLSPIGTVLSTNGGGLGLDPTSWPTVWFKGGSEPEVLTLGYLARDSQGRTFVVTLLAEDPGIRLDGASALVLNSLARGSFALLARQRTG